MTGHAIHIIGIDCAVDPTNVGLTFAITDRSGARLLDADIGEHHEGVVDQVAAWIARTETTLLALDTPLGWPRDIGITLATHKAGEFIDRNANMLFRRETDRKVRKMVGVQSLDVGADRIARTALAALKLLDDIRTKTKLPIPLAWEPKDLKRTQVIEVYPAATLAAHGLPHTGYKDSDQRGVRRKIIKGLSQYLALGDESGALAEDAHVLDAALCVLAGIDFINGEAVAPDNLAIAWQEGWIWTRPVVV